MVSKRRSKKSGSRGSVSPARPESVSNPASQPASLMSRGFWQGAIAATVAAVLVLLCTQPLGHILDDLYGPGKDMVKQVVSREALRVTQIDSNASLFQAKDSLGTERVIPASLITSSTAAELLKEYGAAPIGESTVDILVENDRSETIEITGMRSVVHQRSAAFTGSLIRPSGGGPPIDMVRLAFDLDRDEAPAMSVDKSLRATNVPFFDSKYIPLAPGEKLMFHLIASTSSGACRWTVILDFVDGEHRKSSTTVGDPRHPYSATAAAPAYGNGYERAGDRLNPVDLAEICGGDCRPRKGRKS